tara:strand:+ start:1729 stop:3039 length:1311 start_codon:yes stop_codon:yes gene_type:complete
MSKNITESIFNSKNNLNDFYPRLAGVVNFDLEREHLFYGRIDNDGDAVYLDDGNLKQIYGGARGTHFAADFVSEAFEDFRKNVRKAANGNMLDNNGVFPTNLKVEKAWGHGDLEYNYNQHINNLYTDFVSNYLQVDRRHATITDQFSFIKEFMRYAIRNAKYFPVTKTGYILSNHCSPFISGLMIEIARERHGLPTNARILSYVKDPNFVFFSNEAKKFGFMIDKNAPWRLVFNLASGQKDRPNVTGAQRFMDRFGVSYDNVFKYYYRKAHLEEMLNLRNLFFSLYDSFYKQFATYEVVDYVKCVKREDTRDLRVISDRKPRNPPLELSGEAYYEYWLKIVLKLRLMEAERPHTNQNFNFFVNEMLDNKRLFGPEAALEYINNLTKGFNVTTFNMKGSYWHGVKESEYQRIRRQALDVASEPNLVQHSVTATKNIK